MKASTRTLTGKRSEVDIDTDPFPVTAGKLRVGASVHSGARLLCVIIGACLTAIAKQKRSSTSRLDTHMLKV